MDKKEIEKIKAQNTQGLFVGSLQDIWRRRASSQIPWCGKRVAICRWRSGDGESDRKVAYGRMRRRAFRKEKCTVDLHLTCNAGWRHWWWWESFVFGDRWWLTTMMVVVGFFPFLSTWNPHPFWHGDRWRIKPVAGWIEFSLIYINLFYHWYCNATVGAIGMTRFDMSDKREMVIKWELSYMRETALRAVTAELMSLCLFDVSGIVGQYMPFYTCLGMLAFA